jgi:Tfp pilus assembly protein PilV
MKSLRSRFLRIQSRDSGFTLPEVIMYGLLLGIVLGVVASMMVSGQTAERTIRNVFDASTDGQLLADSLETGVRNASGYKVTAPTESTQLLSARVAQGDTSIVWNCVSWYYSPDVDGGSVWYKSSPTAINEPSSSTLPTWTRLVSGVKPASGTKIFEIAGSQLTFSYKVDADGNPPATISSSATSRAQVWSTAPCF